jgi:hypothetical protein
LNYSPQPLQYHHIPPSAPEYRTSYTQAPPVY